MDQQMVRERNMKQAEQSGRKTPEFEPPMVRTFTGKEIQAEIGPAQMCSPSPCPVSP